MLKRLKEEVEYFFMEHGVNLAVGVVGGVIGSYIGMGIAKLIGLL